MALILDKQNPELSHAVRELQIAAKTHDAAIWGAVAQRLGRARHQTTPVNVGHLERLVQDKEVVVVPGKLLADGSITKPITVAAFQCSPAARSKIQAAGGTVLTIHELIKSKPDGAGVRIFG
ncbi:MAG: 50S ribosomal protein L18e [Thermoplasmata archaeon]|jgi:large subunit ribosomal protein L18e